MGTLTTVDGTTVRESTPGSPAEHALPENAWLITNEQRPANPTAGTVVLPATTGDQAGVGIPSVGKKLARHPEPFGIADLSCGREIHAEYLHTPGRT
jgi:hypothetical protein